MTVQINIPKEAEAALRGAWGNDLDRAALEALIIEGYRTGKLSLGQVAELLGLETRFQAQAWLGQRKVPMNYDLEELERDRRTLAKHFPEMGE